MAVDAAEERQVEERRLEELAEGDDDDDIGRPGADLRHRVVGVHVLRGDDGGNAVLHREGLAGARRQRLATPGRTVRLGDDADDFKLRLAKNRAETGCRSSGRSHENNAHSRVLYHILIAHIPYSVSQHR